MLSHNLRDYSCFYVVPFTLLSMYQNGSIRDAHIALCVARVKMSVSMMLFVWLLKGVNWNSNLV